MTGGQLIALVGPDGAGKSTVCRALVAALHDLGTASSTIYMGVSADSADRLLPTTRLARRWKRRRGGTADTSGPRLASDVSQDRRQRGVTDQVRAGLRLANRVAEESQREATVRWRIARGETVVVDRHYRLDYHATDVTRRDLAWDRRAHGWFLRHALRYPDLVIHLHAPAEVLHERKGEGTVEVLAQRQIEYDALADEVPRFERVSVLQPLEETVRDVLDLVKALSDSDRPTALVTDAERGSAVAIIRSLDAAGWRVIAAASDPRAPGLHSRSASATVVHASTAEDPDLAAKQIARAVEDHRCRLVFPVTDQMVRICRQAALPASTVVAAADPAAYAAASDKWQTVEAALRLGVPVPRSVLVRSTSELHAAAAELGWPVVLKPRWSVTEHNGNLVRHDVVIADGPRDLEPQGEDLAVDVIVQEFHPGDGVGVELLLDRGQVVAAFQHRRLREYPLRGGPSSFRIGEALDPDLLKWSVALLADLGWTGLAMVEFKVGADGPALMEINARVWGSLPLATRSGVDFPALCAAVHLGQPTATAISTYRPGVRSRDLRLELMWIAAVLRGQSTPSREPQPPRRQAVLAALRLFLPSDGYDVLSLRDPGAGVADVRQAARHLARKARAGR